MPKFMFHDNILNCQQQISGIIVQHWGSKYFTTTLKYLDWESKYFQVVGPHGGPCISEGVQILQHYFEVFGPGDPNTSK